MAGSLYDPEYCSEPVLLRTVARAARVSPTPPAVHAACGAPGSIMRRRQCIAELVDACWGLASELVLRTVLMPRLF